MPTRPIDEIQRCRDDRRLPDSRRVAVRCGSVTPKGVMTEMLPRSLPVGDLAKLSRLLQSLATARQSAERPCRTSRARRDL